MTRSKLAIMRDRAVGRILVRVGLCDFVDLFFLEQRSTKSHHEVTPKEYLRGAFDFSGVSCAWIAVLSDKE